MAITTLQGATCAPGSMHHSVAQDLEQFGNQHLAQGHFSMNTAGAGNRTTDLLVIVDEVIEPIVLTRTETEPQMVYILYCMY